MDNTEYIVKQATKLLDLRELLPEENIFLTEVSNLLRNLALTQIHKDNELQNAKKNASKWKSEAKKLKEELNFFAD